MSDSSDGTFRCQACQCPLNHTDLVCWKCGSDKIEDCRPFGSLGDGSVATSDQNKLNRKEEPIILEESVQLNKKSLPVEFYDYAYEFLKKDLNLHPLGISSWYKDPAVKAHGVEHYKYHGYILEWTPSIDGGGSWMAYDDAGLPRTAGGDKAAALNYIKAEIDAEIGRVD